MSSTPTRATDSCFHARRVGHVNLTGSSTERLTAFYTEVMGLEQVFEVTAVSATFFSNGNTHHDVAVVQAHETRPVGLGHLGIELASEEDLLAGMAMFEDRGIEPEMIYDHGLAVSAYLRDPSGHLVEFYWDTVTDWRSYFTDRWGERIGSLWTDVTPIDQARPGHHFADEPEMRTPPRSSAGASWLLAAGLDVVDLDASVDFYAQVGGFEVLRRSEGAALLGGSLGKPDLALVETGAMALRSALFVADPGHTLDDVARGFASGGSPARRSEHAVSGVDPDGTAIVVLDATHPIDDGDLVLELLVGP